MKTEISRSEAEPGAKIRNWTGAFNSAVTSKNLKRNKNIILSEHKTNTSFTTCLQEIDSAPLPVYLCRVCRLVDVGGRFKKRCSDVFQSCTQWPVFQIMQVTSWCIQAPPHHRKRQCCVVSCWIITSICEFRWREKVFLLSPSLSALTYTKIF